MSGDASPGASTRVRREWLRRVEAEYRSSAIAQELALWLTRVGASPDLIRDALRIADEELAHAELSYEVYADAGGSSWPAIDRDTLAIERRGGPLEHDVARVAVRVFCLGETVAVPLFSHLRANCTVASARRALDRVLRDEVGHREFGWDLLHWLAGSAAGADIRALVTAELPAMLAALEASYGGGDGDTIPAEDRAWGLAPAADYASILRDTFERAFAPRFTEVGIDVRAARRRASGERTSAG